MTQDGFSSSASRSTRYSGPQANGPCFTHQNNARVEARESEEIDIRKQQDESHAGGVSLQQSNEHVSAQAKVRTTSTTDGKLLAFRLPSTQDLYQLGMSSSVGRKGSALVASFEDAESCEGVPSSNCVAGAAVERLLDEGGASISTRVCRLTHAGLEGVSISVHHALLDEIITQFLDEGSRISQLRVHLDETSFDEDFYARHGFIQPNKTLGGTEKDLWLVGDRQTALNALDRRKNRESSATLINLRARLLHDARDLEGAIQAYLRAVQMDPARNEIFRGLGGAYQMQGQHQLAFASYQQCINNDPSDLLAYLKLGMLYEELAVGKYEGAGDHAIRCFDYYLQHSGSQDTDVLTRLGNMQVLRLDPAAGARSYEKALAIDANLANVWFNKANAHLKLGQEEQAAECLHEHIRLQPDGSVSSKYLLASLGADPSRLTDQDQVEYARELFDYYASSYDDHMRKKLLYTGPRLLRQNIRTVYNATFQTLPEETRHKYNNDVLVFLNQSLTILDIGCGTGLVGSWFKDYGKRIVGVDVSPVMLKMATKKGCYHELRTEDAREYLAASEDSLFDVIIAAETFQYMGRLDGLFRDIHKALRRGGHLAFTVDRRDGQEGPYVLKADGTYAYTHGYLEEMARTYGFEIILLKQHAARVERGNPAPGYLGVFRKVGGVPSRRVARGDHVS